MTAPGMGSGSELPRDVHTAAQLGNILQSLNATKLKAASSGRLPEDSSWAASPMTIQGRRRWNRPMTCPI